jgi:amino acid transporter
MGRENALPRKFFGKVDTKRFIPQNNVLFVGAVTLVGVFVLNFQLTAEMLNFGAFIAFMGVNLSVFFHFFIKEKSRKFIYIVPPVIGFLFCFSIRISLPSPAKIMGGIWFFAGFIYLIIRTKGFKRKPVILDFTDV